MVTTMTPRQRTPSSRRRSRLSILSFGPAKACLVHCRNLNLAALRSPQCAPAAFRSGKGRGMGDSGKEKTLMFKPLASRARLCDRTVLVFAAGLRGALRCRLLSRQEWLLLLLCLRRRGPMAAA